MFSVGCTYRQRVGIADVMQTCKNLTCTLINAETPSGDALVAFSGPIGSNASSECRSAAAMNASISACSANGTCAAIGKKSDGCWYLLQNLQNATVDTEQVDSYLGGLLYRVGRNFAMGQTFKRCVESEWEVWLWGGSGTQWADQVNETRTAELSFPVYSRVDMVYSVRQIGATNDARSEISLCTSDPASSDPSCADDSTKFNYGTPSPVPASLSVFSTNFSADAAMVIQAEGKLGCK